MTWDVLSPSGRIYHAPSYWLAVWLSVQDHIYVSQPAAYLRRGIECKGIRPVEGDRGYWADRLGIDLDGCYVEIHREHFAPPGARKSLVGTEGLAEWERVLLLEFRG